MTHDNGNEPYEAVQAEPSSLPLEAADQAFLITASELRDRKTRRRRKHTLVGRAEAIRRLAQLGLKASEPET